MATAKLYGRALKHIVLGEFIWTGASAATVKAALVKATYTPDQDVDEFWSAVVANECGTSGTGYTAGGYTVPNKSVPAYVAGSNLQGFDCDDLTMTPLTFPTNGPRYLVYFATNAGANTTWPLLCWQDFGAAQTPDGGPIIVTQDTTGLFTVAAA